MLNPRLFTMSPLYTRDTEIPLTLKDVCYSEKICFPGVLAAREKKNSGRGPMKSSHGHSKMLEGMKMALDEDATVLGFANGETGALNHRVHVERELVQENKINGRYLGSTHRPMPSRKDYGVIEVRGAFVTYEK